MTLSETTKMATDTSSTGNQTHESMENQPDEFVGQYGSQEQSDGPAQQDKLRQRTLALIKPDAVEANHQQAIIDKITLAGFTIIQQKQFQFTLAQACLFYREHEGKSFYDQLTEWMSSAPIYAMVLEKENAIQDWRTLMGPTNAIKAREIDPTSIRALFGTDGSHNASHGSDCLTSAEREIDIVFGSGENLTITTTNDNVVQTDLSTAQTSISPSPDHDESLEDNTRSNKEQSLATTTKETDSSPDVDGLNTKATTATDDTDSFVPPTKTTLLHTNNDVEHHVITSDSLSHTTPLDHDDAPTCPKSDFVELPSGDNNQSATVTSTSNTIQESTATNTDAQESTSQANTDNEAPTHVNSNIEDETPKEKEDLGLQNDTECHHDASLLDQQQQQQSIPVTENLVLKDDESTTVPSTPGIAYNDQQQQQEEEKQQQTDDDKDEITSLDEKVDEQEKEVESLTKTPETSTTMTADDNITQATDHGMDSSIDDSSANDGIVEQQMDQDLKKAQEDDDYHNITPEQEMDSLLIQEANSATDSVTNIDSANINNEKENVPEIDTPSTTKSDDIKSTEITTIESTIHDSGKTTDTDKEELAVSQDAIDTVEELRDESGDMTVTEANSDATPLAMAEEKSNGAVTMDTTPIAGESAAEEMTNSTTVLGSTTSDVTVFQSTAQSDENASISVELTPNTTVPESIAASTLVAVTENVADDEVIQDKSVVADESDDKTGEPESIETPIPDVPAADQSESTPLESVSQVAMVDEYDELTKESNVADEPEAIPVDTKAENIEDPKKLGVDDELQVTSESIPEVAVADTAESSKTVGESEHTIEQNTSIGLNEPAPAEKQVEHAEAPQAQNLVETEAGDVAEPIAMNKPPTTETDEKNQQDTASTTTAIENELMAPPSDNHQKPSDNDDQAKDLDEATPDKANSVSTHDEEATIDSSNTTKSDEESVKERKVASTKPPSSTTRSPTAKSPTSTTKTPVKSTSPPSATKKSSKPAAGTTKPATTTRLRRPGTTPTTGTGSSATTPTATGMKKVTPKTSTSPGRSPLPRVATLAKKPATKTTDESKPSTTEAKPATKKRSAVISRLTAPTAASANKRTSEATTTSSATASTTKTTSVNGTVRTRVTSTSGHHAPATTSRPATKVSAVTTTKRTSPSSTADKTSTATTRRISPPSSTKTARSTTAAPASSSRLSSTTTKSPSADANASKRSPTRRVSPPTSTHLTSTTKPTTKVSKPTTTEKKTDVIRKKTKPSATTATKTKTVKKSDSNEKKDDGSAHEETIHNDDSAAEHDDGTVKKTVEDTTDHPDEHHDNAMDPETITPEQPSIVETTIQQEQMTETDAEVSTTTTQDTTSLNPTTTDSSTKRPRTPEMAQLRNKFENLQAPTTVTPTRSSNKQPSSAPHNIKDLISRFN